MDNQKKMTVTLFKVKGMDCPSEENIIRMKLAELGDNIASLDFDLRKRTLAVTHSESSASRLAEAMESVDMGAKMIETRDADAADRPSADTSQRRVLYRVLLVNAVFFALEMAIGLLSRSMGLVADSLDMLADADATVYGMSLMVVGAAVGRKKRVALWSGILQTLLAVAGMVEVVRRFVSPSLPPEYAAMIWMSALSLVANAYCLWLLNRQKSGDAHMRASVIFSANDVVVNLGVILSGVAVWVFNSRVPDLVVGAVVFVIVLRGAVRIFKLSR